MRPRDAMEGLVNAIRLGAWVCGVILLASAPAFAAPCTVPATCSEWVNVAQSSARLLIYRSFPLAVKNPDVTRALVVIHGAGRDADNYFQHALAAAFLAGALENTVVISPRFASTNNGCADTVAEHEVTWQCGGPSRWTSGGAMLPNGPGTSFDVVDDLLRTLARKDGLQQRVGYTAKMTDAQLQKQLSSRKTTYLLGGLDILPLFGFDDSCAANAQGPTRLARGLAFSRYVGERFGAKHQVAIVAACGHNARCMFGDNVALPLLFPKQ